MTMQRAVVPALSELVLAARNVHDSAMLIEWQNSGDNRDSTSMSDRVGMTACKGPSRKGRNHVCMPKDLTATSPRQHQECRQNSIALERATPQAWFENQVLPAMLEDDGLDLGMRLPWRCAASPWSGRT